MIAPEDDDRVVAQFQLIELVEDAADEGVGISYATRIVATDLKSEGGIGVWVPLPTVVFHKLARSMPSGLAGGLEGMRDGRKFCLEVRFYVAEGGAEGKVRPDDADGEEEALPGGGAVGRGV